MSSMFNSGSDSFSQVTHDIGFVKKKKKRVKNPIFKK